MIRDLRTYAEAADAEVFFFTDASGTEADAIVDTGDGRWLAIEVKLGGPEALDQAARSLMAVRRKVDASRMGEARLVVITATGGYPHERPDGVAVAPFFTLGP